MEEVIEYFKSKEFLMTIVVILIAIGIYVFLSMIFNKSNKLLKNNAQLTKKRLTYIKLIRSAIKYFLTILTILLILQVNGINVSSVLTGLGIASVIGGLAIQDALKDIVTGINILAEDYYSVGDMVKINGITGKVVEFGIKTTKIEDINTNSLCVIANRNISEAIKISNFFGVEIPTSYDDSKEKIEGIINIILDKVKKLEHIETVEYRGIQSFEDSSIIYKLFVYANPKYHLQLKRDINGIIKEVFDENKIEIPYMQVDIHNK